MNFRQFQFELLAMWPANRLQPSHDQIDTHYKAGSTPAAAKAALIRRKRAESKPAPGTQQWAETYRDDIGESHD